MHLHDLLGWDGPMSHRQYLAWQEWLREDRNHPSRSDYYLMRVAREVILPHLVEGAEPPDLNDYVLKFGPVFPSGDMTADPNEGLEDDGPPIMTDELIIAAQKQIAIARVMRGSKVPFEHRWVNKRGEPIPPPDKSV